MIYKELTPDDSIVVTIINSGTAADQAVVVFNFSNDINHNNPSTIFIPFAAGPSTTQSIVVTGPGFLKSLSIGPQGITPPIGEIYVFAEIRKRGIGGNSSPVYPLIKDYTTVDSPACWPYIGQSMYQSIRGACRVIPIPDPAAGANLAYVVPTLQELQILGLRFFFTADANVANRSINILIQDFNGNVYFRTAYGTAITAGQSFKFSFINGLTISSTGSDITQPLPNLIYMYPGWQLQINVTNKQVGDQIATTTLTAIRNASPITPGT